jgi:hypothetical protein
MSHSTTAGSNEKNEKRQPKLNCAGRGATWKSRHPPAETLLSPRESCNRPVDARDQSKLSVEIPRQAANLSTKKFGMMVNPLRCKATSGCKSKQDNNFGRFSGGANFRARQG